MMLCPREQELDWAAIRLWRAGIPPVDAGSLPAELRDLAPLLRHAGECVRCGEIIRLLYATEDAQRSDEVAETPAASSRVSAVGPGVLPLFPLAGISATGAARSADSGSPDSGSTVDSVLDAAEEYLVAADSPGAHPAGGSGEGDSLVLTLATQDQRYVVRIFPNQAGSGATAVLLGGDTASDAQVGATEQGRAGREAAGPNLSLRVAGVDYPFDARGYARLVGFPAEEIALIVK